MNIVQKYYIFELHTKIFNFSIIKINFLLTYVLYLKRISALYYCCKKVIKIDKI